MPGGMICRRVRGLGLSVLTALSLVVQVAGCGGQSGFSFREPASRRPDIDAEMLTRGSLSIPADQPFLAPLLQSSQSGSNARGEARPIGEHGAACQSQAKGKGHATGEFLLGYAFDNATGKALDAVIKVKLAVKNSAAIEDTAVSEEEASVTGMLDFSVKTTRGLEVKRESLLNSDVARGPRTSSDSMERVYEVRLEPGMGYYLMLEGRTQASANENQTASAALEVSDVSFEISWRGAETEATESAAAPLGGREQIAAGPAGRAAAPGPAVDHE